ncbi:VOC family protein [Micromonospora sp. RHAY321]|uniref:VOC family protein n=1 Tax=unclassified Micromonospora TaxID=2617518 RepID=UPI00207CE86D|nr:VOC family protein [Micromonospora sp. RHAY321]MCO1593984.1 VOC family protein [Micromonospora sp. RHAY321]
MPALNKLVAVTMDCPDPAILADFYKAAIGWDLIYSDEHAAYLSDGGDVRVGFQRVEGYAAPTWPGQGVPQQMHFDIAVDDIEEATTRLVNLGAAPAEEQPGETAWRVMLDPAGHPFCITTSY